MTDSIVVVVFLQPCDCLFKCTLPVDYGRRISSHQRVTLHGQGSAFVQGVRTRVSAEIKWVFRPKSRLFNDSHSVWAGFVQNHQARSGSC